MSYLIKFQLSNKRQIHSTIFVAKDSIEAQKQFFASYWEDSPVIVSITKQVS